MRFDTSEMGGTWTEICAYGTAVRIASVIRDSSAAEAESHFQVQRAASLAALGHIFPTELYPSRR